MEQQEIYWGIVNKDDITLKLSVDCKHTIDQISGTQGLLMQAMHYPRQDPDTKNTTVARTFLAEVHGLYTNIGEEPLNYLGRVMTYGIKYARDYNKKQIGTSE